VEHTSVTARDRLAYVSNGDIYELNTVTWVSVNLTNTTETSEGDPSYSPNGKQMVFAASGVGFSGIYTMRADGSAVTRLTSSVTDWHKLPKWSPDASASRSAAGTRRTIKTST
jgi:Tol biopolymer transport system component